MEKNKTNQAEPRSGSPEGSASPRSEPGAGSYDIVVRQASVGETGGMYNRSRQPEPIVQALQELLDVPRQILPEQTYTHLKNAAREATLAVVSLVNNLSGAAKGSGSKTTRHIDVE